MRYRVFTISLFVIFLVGAAACQKSSSEATNPLRSELQEVLASGTTTSTTVPTLLPTTLAATATPTEMAVLARSKACLDCHSDKQALIDTAKEEEVVEPENEGVG